MATDETLLDRPTPQRFAVEALLALAIGWALYQVSCWLVPAGPMTGNGFDIDWQRMSADPFALPGRFPHRILAPFLAWATGWGGDGYLEFTHGLHVLLLASTAFVTLRLRGSLLDAVLVAAMVAITAPTQLYKLHWVGYTDPICYSLFLWMIVAVRNPYVFWSLFLVDLMNHELAGFLLPWLWFLRRRTDGRWRLDLVLAGLACAIYLGFYLFVKSQAAQLFSSDYFLSHPLFPGGTFVVWNLAAVHLTTTFGPMLAMLAWHQHHRRAGAERWHLWLVLLGVATIFCIAFDWARHSNLLLLPLVIASARFLQQGRWHRFVFASLIGLTLLLFWWVPPWSPTAWPTSLFANPQLLVETGMVIIGEGEYDIGFGDLSAAVGRWLPAIWKPLLVVHAIGAAIWLLGPALVPNPVQTTT